MNDPLDLDLLRALQHRRDSEAQLLDRIEQHLERYDGYLPFSGGKDSLAVLHLALQVDPNVPVAFFNSGTEFPQTLDYLEHLSGLWDLNLTVYNARIPLLNYLDATGAWAYDREIVTTGFTLRDNLIEEPASRAHHDHGPGELWGVRAAESHSRTMAYRNARAAGDAPGQIRRDDGTVAYCPIWDWSTDQVWAYIHTHHLPINPVYDILRRLGAPEHHQRVGPMIDGDHLTSGRATWLKLGWPAEFEHLATVLPRLREFT
ncbi:phosphoadenosine phosphosulfate reductase family protein [Dietzia sp. CQ4]|uniref:phosphoadenosine phosphosulfate reductase domain-containing protein n=1 Tax=Dietzia sp. (strain CQ4) TaxID=370437 RepID=UPI0015FB86D1|nr:phosphoadenosine phosphosulfate reductase family protein [Dietzia sp. CQ4]MBB1033153.1 phosphoadenosine phosphosulfate reductase family protein [Dietzia sp. CQ4]